jgi:hypothetical protein
MPQAQEVTQRGLKPKNIPDKSSPSTGSSNRLSLSNNSDSFKACIDLVKFLKVLILKEEVH